MADTTSSSPSLDELGLDPNEPVRWRRREGSHWNHGMVIKRENDGSVGVRDSDGAWRSIPVAKLEVQGLTRRGTRRWQPLPERAAAEVQLRLW